VKVSEFGRTVEAWLARDRLTEEGIQVMLDGEVSNELFGPFGPGVIRLFVPEDDAARAVGILASLGIDDLPREASEEEATAGVWVCSTCGEGVPLDRDYCPDCGTSRGAFRDGEPGKVLGWRPRPTQASENHGIL